MTYDWVKPGAELVALKRYGGYGPTVKIDKVHKTGRFTLEGDQTRQQYKAYDNRTAVSTGSGYWSTHLELLTDEIRADVRKQQRVDSAKKVLLAESARLEALARGVADSDDILAAAEEIRGRGQQGV